MSFFNKLKNFGQLQNSSLQNDLRRTQLLLVATAILYPAWTVIHHWVEPDNTDSYLERLIIGFYFLGLYAFSKFVKPITEKKLMVLQSGRWVLTAHYFSLIARNNLSPQYVLIGFLIIFAISTLFTSRRSFIAYALFVIGLSLFCTDGSDAMPDYLFQLGITTCLFLSYLSLSDRFRLIESLKESESVFRGIFQNSGIGIALTGLDGRISMINKALAQIFEMPVEEIENKHFSEFYHPEHAPDGKFEELSTGKIETLRVERRYVNNKQKTVWGMVTSTLVRINERPQYVISMFQDITRRKEAEEQLSKQQQTMVHSSKMQALGEMAGGVAHEINTPLGVIQLRTDRLLKTAQENKIDAAEAASSLAAISETAKRIAKIVQGLRQFARDGSKSALEPGKLTAIVEDTLSLCQQRFHNNGVKIEVVANMREDEILCRSVEISQIILNLLNNSYDAVGSLAQEKKWIKIELSEDAERVHLAVFDGGPGVPKEVQSKIMQPFFTTKGVGKGTGLGLSISKGIAEGHGGQLRMEVYSAGTKFILTLPKLANVLAKKVAATG